MPRPPSAPRLQHSDDVWERSSHDLLHARFAHREACQLSRCPRAHGHFGVSAWRSGDVTYCASPAPSFSESSRCCISSSSLRCGASLDRCVVVVRLRRDVEELRTSGARRSSTSISSACWPGKSLSCTRLQRGKGERGPARRRRERGRNVTVVARNVAAAESGAVWTPIDHMLMGWSSTPWPMEMSPAVMETIYNDSPSEVVRTETRWRRRSMTELLMQWRIQSMLLRSFLKEENEICYLGLILYAFTLQEKWF